MDETTQEQQYEIKVHGEAFCGNGPTKRVEAYEATFTLPVRGGVALSEIQNRLIEPNLRKRWADLTHVRTCAILSEKLAKGEAKKLTAKDIPGMTLEELNIFVISAKLKTNPNNFGSLEEAKRQVLKEIDDVKMAKKVQADKAQAAAAKKAGKVGGKKSKGSADPDPENDEFPDDI